MGKLYVIATPIGNLKDITLRALETIEECDILAVEDTRHTLKLLNHYNIKKKMISYHKYNEKERVNLILDLLKNKNLNVGLLTNAGTPCISDPGYIIVKCARENGIEVVPIPGPSAITTALSVSGLPSNQFLFYGFLPNKKTEREKILTKIKNTKVETIIFFESPKRITNLMNLLKDFFPKSTVCVCNELTKMFEKVYYGNIDKVVEEIENNPHKEMGEYTVIIYYNPEEEPSKLNLSVEALIINELVTNNLSLKEAINLVSKKYGISKKEVYNKAINLRNKILNNGGGNL